MLLVLKSEVNGATPEQIFHFSIHTHEILSNDLVALFLVFCRFQTFYEGLEIFETKRMESFFETLQFPRIELVIGTLKKLFVLVLVSTMKYLSFLLGFERGEIVFVVVDGLGILGNVEDFVFYLGLLIECHGLS